MRAPRWTTRPKWSAWWIALAVILLLAYATVTAGVLLTWTWPDVPHVATIAFALAPLAGAAGLVLVVLPEHIMPRPRSADLGATTRGASTPTADLVRFTSTGTVWSLLHQRDPRLYLVTTTLDALGTGLVLPVTVLYFTVQVELPPVELGLGLSLAGASGAAATPLAGPLLERWGARTLGASCYAASALAFASYLLVRDFWTFLAVVCLAQCADRISRPARVELAAGLVEAKDRTRLLAVQRTLRNAGYGLGGVAATAALAAGMGLAYDILILGNAASYLLTGYLVTRMRAAPRKPSPVRQRSGFGPALRDRRYVSLTILNMMLLLHTSALEVGMPLWIVQDTDAPPWLAGVLFSLNTILVIACQVVAARSADHVVGAARAYAWSAALLLVTSCLFAASAGAGPRATVILLVAAVVVLTLGEVLASVGEWGVSLGLAPEAQRSRYLSLFATGAAAQLAFGPAAVTAALSTTRSVGWLLLGGVFLASGVGAYFVATRAARVAVHTSAFRAPR